MSKRARRWPIRKITVTAVVCLLLSVGLCVLSVYLDHLTAPGQEEENPAQALQLPGFVLIMGMGMGVLTVSASIWLGLRIKEARTPPWERPPKKRRRRRR